jgi:2-amino-4-hydroxy-6-hydroxymethyldihydropteridine diphosphokinase
VVLLGANLNNPEFQIHKAIGLLEATCGKVVRRSSMYRSSPWGYTEQASFLNQAVLLRTPLPPLALLQRLQGIEQRLGRIKNIPMGPRVIDLDILAYGQIQLHHQRLEIPHRHLPERRFALLPFAEIWKKWKHPELDSGVEALLKKCSDTGEVTLWRNS